MKRHGVGIVICGVKLRRIHGRIIKSITGRKRGLDGGRRGSVLSKRGLNKGWGRVLDDRYRRRSGDMHSRRRGLFGCCVGIG